MQRSSIASSNASSPTAAQLEHEYGGPSLGDESEWHQLEHTIDRKDTNDQVKYHLETRPIQWVFSIWVCSAWAGFYNQQKDHFWREPREMLDEITLKRPQPSREK